MALQLRTTKLAMLHQRRKWFLLGRLRVSESFAAIGANLATVYDASNWYFVSMNKGDVIAICAAFTPQRLRIIVLFRHC